MKQTLLFLVFTIASFSSFSQSSEVEMELQELDEVVILGYQSTTRMCTTIFCYGSYCVGVEVVGDVNKTEDVNLRKEVLYPNPSPSGLFNLKLLKDYKVLKTNVYTMAGQRVWSQNFANFDRNVTIDLSQFPKGIYLIELAADNEKLPTKKAVFR